MSSQDPNKHVWDVDWRGRIYLRLRAIGESAVTDWLAKNPCIPYVQMADRLGDDVAAFQLEFLQMDEARERLELRKAAMDSLGRDIRRYLKSGWKKHVQGDFDTASVFAEWLNRVIRVEPKLDIHLRKVWSRLKELAPPIGWIPETPQDRFIVEAFDSEWPDPV